jgi:hypothetical protein
MDAPNDDIPCFLDDPVIQLILRGRASNLREAEDIYLDESIPNLLELLASPLSNEELEQHPLIKMYARHGGRSWEDSFFSS